MQNVDWSGWWSEYPLDCYDYKSTCGANNLKTRFYRVSLKKGTFSIFVLFLLKKSDLTFHMCFRIRISIPFQLVAKITSTQNPNCFKNAESTCANMLFIPALRCEAWAVASLLTSMYLITRFKGSLDSGSEVSEYCFLDRIRIRILFGIRILTEYEYE